VTRLAKAMSAFPNGRGAPVAAINDARSFATRGAFSDADGSGASSGRPYLLPLALATLLTTTLLALVLPSVSQAGNSVVKVVGGTSTGTLGAQFNTPRGIAVSQNGAGNATPGDVFVVDSSNHRVQQLDSEGNFIRAWGADVSLPAGGTTMETCTVAADCKIGITTVQVGGAFNQPQGIAIDPSDGSIYVTDQGNRRVQKFTLPPDPADPVLFNRAWGWDVLTGGVTTFEVCTAAAECKIAAAAAAGGGQFANAIGHSAIDPNTGDVYVADSTNRRVQKFEADGDFLYAFGWDVDTAGTTGQLEKCTATCRAGNPAGTAVGQFPNNQPTRVAVDSSGVVYTVESASSFRLQRFNAAATSASVFSPANAGGTNSNTSPFEIQINPANDQIFVTKAAGQPVERRVLQLDASGGLLDTHAEGGGLPATNGLGVEYGSGRLYMSASHRIFILDTPVAPTATLEPVATFDATTATFEGHVDPKGVQTNYRFEYSDDSFATIRSVPLADADAGPVDSNNAVQQSVVGLEPNTAYRVRLIATKAFGGGTVTTPFESFTTEAAAPDVSGTSAYTIGEGVARLVGYVDANRQATSYRFEYGTAPCSANPCTSVPVPDADAGSGTGPALVTQQVSGLSTGQEYHFRLVATNTTGTDEGEDTVFELNQDPPAAGACTNAALRAGASAHLPNCRAYEMVSPVDKSNTDIGFLAWRDGPEAFLPYPTPSAPIPIVVNGVGYKGPMATSPVGDEIVFPSVASFAGVQYGGGRHNEIVFPGIFYLAHRDASAQRWVTEPLVPQRTAPGVSANANEVPNLALAGSGANLRASALIGGRTSVFHAADEPFCLPDSASPGAPSPECLYRRDHAAMKLMSPIGGPPNGSTTTPNPTGDVVAFESISVLTSDPGVPASGFKAYAWSGGQTVLVSVLPDGTPVNGAVGSSVTGGQSPSVAMTVGSSMHAISADGRYVFFSTQPQQTNPTVATNVYRHDLATEQTVLVSGSQTTAPDPLGPKAKIYYDATPDQSPSGPAAVFFASAEQLTDDANTGPARAGSDLYRYEINSDALTNISASTNDANGAQVVSVIGASEDGKRVYYVAKGLVIAGKGVAGENNLYLWTDDGTSSGVNSFVATLGASDASNWNATRGGGGLSNSSNVQISKTARVSQDGARLLFESQRDLTGYSSNGLSQAFIYDAHANDGAGKLVCISCSPTGEPGSKGASVPRTSSGARVGYDLSRALSFDGRRAFFETEDALVPSDQNGKLDVYQWEAGVVSLISSGLGQSNSYFHGASSDGDDVFILTRDRLAPQDPETLYDIYDARVGGGLPPQPTAPPCTGEDCKPVAAQQPNYAAPSTSTLSGRGNAVQRFARCNRSQVSRGGRCVAKRTLARRACAKRKGKAKQRCIRSKKRRFNSIQRRQLRQDRAASNNRRAGR
jgi:sugar lactone lactonase YvrE